MEEEKTPTFQSIVLTWWSGLEYNKGLRNEIRRCDNLFDIQLMEGFCKLKCSLKNKLPPHEIPNGNQLALIAGVLVHVQTNLITTEKTPFQLKNIAHLMGIKTNNIPAVSPSRFQRILQTTDQNDLFSRLVCILPLIGNKANLFCLVNDLKYWNDRTRRIWAESYYN